MKYVQLSHAHCASLLGHEDLTPTLEYMWHQRVVGNNKYLVSCIKIFNHYWDNVFINRAFHEVLVVKILPANAGDIRDAGQKDPLDEGLATHSSILAWKTPLTEGPGRRQSMG